MATKMQPRWPMLRGDTIIALDGTAYVVDQPNLVDDDGQYLTACRDDDTRNFYASQLVPNGRDGAKEIQAPSSEPEMVDHPAHYGGDGTYEVFKVAEAWGLDRDAYLFTVLKYIARAGKKDPTKLNEDLRKARNFLTRRIDHPKEP